MHNVAQVDQREDADCGRDAREVVEFDSRHCVDFERLQRTRTRSCRGTGFEDCVGRAGLGDANRRHDRLGVSEINRVPPGLGKRLHIEVKLLWVQESVRRMRFLIIKILGTTTPADILTSSKSGWIG